MNKTDNHRQNQCPASFRLIYHNVIPKLHSIMENEECRKYSRNLFKKSESIYKSFYHIVFLEIFKSFGLYRRAWYRGKVFALGTLLNNSQKNGETV